jgi:hypothetical protein
MIQLLHGIMEEFTADPACPICHGSGHVCEEHPRSEWLESGGCCGGAGMPCECTSGGKMAEDSTPLVELSEAEFEGFFDSLMREVEEDGFHGS